MTLRPVLTASLEAAPSAQSSADYQALRKELDLMRERIAMVELSDFECPFCGRYSRETAPQ